MTLVPKATGDIDLTVCDKGDDDLFLWATMSVSQWWPEEFEDRDGWSDKVSLRGGCHTRTFSFGLFSRSK